MNIGLTSTVHKMNSFHDILYYNIMTELLSQKLLPLFPIINSSHLTQRVTNVETGAISDYCKYNVHDTLPDHC